MKEKLLALSLSIIGAGAIAQQIPLSNLYTENKYLITSAHKGNVNTIEAALNYRSQWVRFKGSPNTAYLTGTYDAGRNISFGAKIVKDESNVLNTTSMMATTAYHLKLGLANSVSLAAGIGFFYNAIDFKKVIATNPTDPLLSGPASNKWNFANEVSMQWKFREFETSLSIPGLISNYRKRYTNVTDDFINQRIMLLYLASYTFQYQHTLQFIPSVLVRHVPAYTTNYDVNLDVKYQEMFSLGIGYRQRAGILGRLGIDITPVIHFAYGYEFFPSGIASYSGGSHEVQITTRIVKKKLSKLKSKKYFRDFLKYKKRK